MADDFEFDDFDDDEECSSRLSSKTEKNNVHSSPGKRERTASKKRRLNFDNDSGSDIVNENRIEKNKSKVNSPSLSALPSSPARNNSPGRSWTSQSSRTTRESGFSQTQSSNTTNDENRERSPTRYGGSQSRDESELESTVSPGKRVHFNEGSNNDISHVVHSPQNSVDSVSSGISMSQNTGEEHFSISSKSGYSCSASSRSLASSSVMETSRSGRSPPRGSKTRSPTKPSLTKRFKVSNLREKSWIKELDDNDESESQKKRKRRMVVQPILGEDKKLLIGTIGRSTLSLRDAGSSQLLHDECVFMCNTLIENQPSVGPVQLQIACDLLNLLSSQENRRKLFFEGQLIRNGEDSPLYAILDMLGSFDEMKDPLQVTHRSPEKKSARLSLFQDSTGPSESRFERNDSYFQQFLDTVGMIVYLMALDCTISDAGISESLARSARAIRYEILAHPRALRGIMSLIRVDPIVSSLRVRPVEVCADEQDASSGPSPGLSSSGSVAASSASSAHSLADPTKTWRFRRRKLQLFDEELCSVPEQAVADDASLPDRNVRKFKPASPGKSDELEFDEFTLTKRPTDLQQKLDKVSCRVIDSLPSPSSTHDSTSMHTCSLLAQVGHRIVGDDVSHSIPLVALGRIIRGKMEWCEKSCLDIEVPDGSSREFGSNPPFHEPKTADEEDEDDDNPLLQTNNLLGKSGCLPLLSRALTETLAAILWLLEKRSPCRVCLSYLRDKFSSLTSLVDDACLMHDDNRELLCREGYTFEFECSLVAGLASFLRVLNNKHLIFGGRVGSTSKMWDEMVLETLRSLTSLTHENAYAARDFLKTKRSRFDKENHEMTAVEVISRVLYAAIMRGKVTGENAAQSNKIRYDSVIFCLNILTNCVESSEGSLTSSLVSVSVPVEMNRNGDKSKSMETNFISWLVQWLVGETGSFREAISTFGSESKHSERRLEANENDQLVSAGNGFVLLASILAYSADDFVQTNTSDSNTSNETVQDLVLANLPGDDYKSKVSFMKNLLTVFCNFYHVSIGDLSVAVIGPIKGLIRKLDNLSLPASA